MQNRVLLGLACCLTVAALSAARAAHGFSYPVNDCVATKQKEAGTYGQLQLKAWATFVKNGDASQRDAAILAASSALADAWSAAEADAAAQGTNCNETTLSV